MHWTEQTETMAKAFAETQKQIWKHWCDLMPGVPPRPHFFVVPQAQAGEEAAEGFKAWTAGIYELRKEVKELREAPPTAFDFASSRRH